jgi:hypothetical protein
MSCQSDLLSKGSASALDGLPERISLILVLRAQFWRAWARAHPHLLQDDRTPGSGG